MCYDMSVKAASDLRKEITKQKEQSKRERQMKRDQNRQFNYFTAANSPAFI